MSIDKFSSIGTVQEIPPKGLISTFVSRRYVLRGQKDDVIGNYRSISIGANVVTYLRRASRLLRRRNS